MSTVSNFLEPSPLLGGIINCTAADVLFTRCHNVFKRYLLTRFESMPWHIPLPREGG
jgi:hypothetical protein